MRLRFHVRDLMLATLAVALALGGAGAIEFWIPWLLWALVRLAAIAGAALFVALWAVAAAMDEGHEKDRAVAILVNTLIGVLALLVAACGLDAAR